MILFRKKPETKPEPKPASEPVQTNRFDDIRKAAAARHKKADTDGSRRRLKQTVEDNRLL